MFTHDGGTRRFRKKPPIPWRSGVWLLAAMIVAASHAAQAHGIVGNRVFPGTLAFDDPAVMDELVFPAVSGLKHPGAGADVTDDRIGLSFSRLLTPTLAFGIE